MYKAEKKNLMQFNAPVSFYQKIGKNFPFL